MPSKIMKRGKLRYRGNIEVQGIKRQKLFPDATMRTYRKAIVWENETKKKLEMELSQTSLESLAIGQWANEYLDEVQERCSSKTFDEKKAAFARLFKDAQLEPNISLAKLTISICRNFLKIQAKARSGNAANKDRKNLGAAWNWGSDNMDKWPGGYNPFLSIKKFPEKRSPRYVPPEEDFWKVYELAEGQDKVMLLTFLHLAGRRGEIFRIKRSDLDFPNSRVRLWTRKRKDGNLEPDWLPMTTELHETLESWWKLRMTQQTIDKEHLFVCLDNYVFCDPYYGKPFTSRQHFMKRLCKRAGIKAFGFHAIRHLTASILYHKGYTQSLIQAVLRHEHPSTTERYLKSLGLEQTREGLEEGLKGPAKIIPLKKDKAPENEGFGG